MDELSYLRKQKEIRYMDAKASYEALNHCLKMLNLNSLPELTNIKEQIKQAKKKLKDIK